MNSKLSFLAELKRRNVLRAGVLYIGVVWALSQGFAQLLPVFDVPNWVVRAFVIAGVVGFPFWLVFAWVYELTPQGLKRESEVPPDQSVTRSTGRKLDFAIIGVLAVAVVLLLTDRFSSHKGAESISDKSIAVLPFENLSDDKSNAYFAEGVQDEILTRLAKIGALRVISRTSTQQYASKPGNLSEIARQLGVANIVEGSVQKAGDVVRVNVQLIRAAGDAHLWADIYDRKLDNLFTVQSEVAGAIAAQLQAQLTHEEKKELDTPLTTVPQAHDAWLRALIFFNRNSEDPTGIEEAIGLLSEAARLDPKFASAWALLSRCHGSQYFQQFDHSAARASAAKAAMDRAIDIAPQTVDTQTALGYYHYWVERDYPAAIRTFSALQEREPNSANAIEALGYIARRQGRGEDSLRLLDRAVELDPLNITVLTEAIWTHRQQRDWAAADRLIERALNLKPDDANLLASKALQLQVYDRLDEADAILHTMRPDGSLQQLVITIELQAHLTRRYAQAADQLKPMLDQLQAAAAGKVSQLTLGMYGAIVGDLQRLAGDSDHARQTLQTSRGNLQSALRNEPDNFMAQMFLARAYASLGDGDKALQTIDNAVDSTPTSRDALYGPLIEERRAAIQTQFGQTDAPIAALQRLLGLKYANAIEVVRLRKDSDWDPLRNDPRFRQLLVEADASPLTAPWRSAKP